MSESTPEIKPVSKPFYVRPKFIGSLFAAIIFLILIFQNWETTTIGIFFWKATLPRSVFFLIFALIGFIVGWLVRRPKAVAVKSKKAE